jgi:peptidoglycan/xylan/chitin deacetylase (PgdA/CDA1 family)
VKVRALALLMALGPVLAVAAAPGPVQAVPRPQHRMPSPAARAAPRPCSSGLVALTFDDGPSRAATARLVQILTARRVPATFFMLGQHVRADPADARLVARSGFVVGNHTWSHPVLTRLGNAAVRAELVSTRNELRRQGIRPSTLMRPPYGAINARVRGVVRQQRLVPVLWTIDSRDWADGTPRQIAARVLGRLHQHRTNIVLQHDGVRRSPISVSAVPSIIDGARRRGFCFAALDAAGRPTPPVPLLRVSVTAASEAGRVPARVGLTLSQPTSRRVSVRVSTAAGSARSGQDFVPVARTVVFPVGSTRASLLVRVVDDALVEPTERFLVRLSDARGLRRAASARSVAIRSDDVAPRPKPAPPATPPTPAAVDPHSA